MPDSSAPMDLTSEKAACALAIVQKLKTAGFDALFAGGCVRDHLLGLNPTDYDIATSATPDVVEKVFEKTIPVGKQFGVILVISKGMQFEVATFRTEGGYQDGRRPGFVNFSNAEEDARRRDFTVNGLFYDPLEHRVLDFVEGRSDLARKQIRCIGNPAERFEEDKLRLLRAVRFAVRLGFQIDEETAGEIRKKAAQISVVSRERIRDELDKIWQSPRAKQGLELLAKLGLWPALWQGIRPEQVLARYQVSETLDPALANAIFFWGLPHQAVGEQLRQLRYSNDVIDQTLKLHDLCRKLESFDALRAGEARILAAEPGLKSAFTLYMRVNPAESKQALGSIQARLARWAGQKLPLPWLNGEDLKSLGLAPGPQIGKILTEAYYLQLEERIQSREQALAWVQTQIAN